MKAVTFEHERVVLRDYPRPEITDSSGMLIRVRSAGLNAADVAQAAGRYRVPPGLDTARPGLELCGDVMDVGPQVQRFAPGDTVMALLGHKAQSEWVVIPECLAMAVPPGLDRVVAGGVPEAFVTAHDALFMQMGVKIGERVLIHGAAGGVGTAAIQLARCAGAHVVATVRNVDVRGKVEALGATVIDPADFRDHGPFDAILETIGAPNIEGNVASLATGGRISVLGVIGGSETELQLRGLMSTRGRILASTLRARPIWERAQAVHLTAKAVSSLLDSGTISMPVCQEFPLESAADAYEAFKQGGKFGKILLTTGA